MAYVDFVVRWDSETETVQTLTDRVLYSLFIKRLKKKKPCPTFICGDSGEGKSTSGGLGLQYILMKAQGHDMRKYLEVMNVVTPLQYPEKIKKILYDKEYKPANIVAIHESRDIIRSTQWQSFLTQSVADINAQSRSIKPLVMLIISQFIRDITTDIRYTLYYYVKCWRPMGTIRGKRNTCRLYFSVVWKDDRDLEKPKLRKRKIYGYIVDKHGRYRPYSPEYLEMGIPPKDIVEKFEQMDTASKKEITQKKLQKLMEELQKEIGVDSTKDKLNLIVEYFAKNQDLIPQIAKRRGDKLTVNKKAIDIYDVPKDKVKEFTVLLNNKMKQIEAQYVEQANKDVLENV